MQKNDGQTDRGFEEKQKRKKRRQEKKLDARETVDHARLRLEYGDVLDPAEWRENRSEYSSSLFIDRPCSKGVAADVVVDTLMGNSGGL